MNSLAGAERRALKILLPLLALVFQGAQGAAAVEGSTDRGIFEATFESTRKYADPFNDVELDVIFTQEGTSWRVPAFWRGSNRWTVRFAPPTGGEYVYRLESTDKTNPDLNGHVRRVTISPYAGSNTLLKRGPPRVSRNGRYFEQADGTPFYWLGDTWYSGLSDRLPWTGFKAMTDDRKAKGYTVVHINVMTVSNEEDAPSDPGFCNEGGCVWEEKFERLNPKYFDFADRRVQYLIDAQIAPVIFGMWRQALGQMGLRKGKQLWRYIIARYGAYPVFWVGGGEVSEQGVAGWTELVRYIRATDPYHHPLTVHEFPPSYDAALTDEFLTDFEMLQPSHFGWASIAGQIAQLNLHYARTTVTKPLVVGEIGWETLGGQHYEDFQRTAFWLAMLNGAAGFSYGNAITGESYSADKPFHRIRLSFLNWDEAMQFPSSAQLGFAATLLRRYPWQHFAPRPDWVSPRGTTLLEPQSAINGFDIDLMNSAGAAPRTVERDYPAGVWTQREGDFRLPYAAGIPGEVRFIYIPATGFPRMASPTVLKLEPNIVYRAYYWEPSLGVKVDLGKIGASAPGEIIHRDTFEPAGSNWDDALGTSESESGELVLRGASMSLLRGIRQTDVVAAVDARAEAEAALILRYQNTANYLAAVYSPKQRAIYLQVRKDGKDAKPIGQTGISSMSGVIRLTAEVRGHSAIVSVTDGGNTFTSPIVDIVDVFPWDWKAQTPLPESGCIGLHHSDDGVTQRFDNFELRKPAAIVQEETLERRLYDARGQYRGVLTGKNWDTYGTHKTLLLDAYRPEGPPFPQDWVLVLERLQVRSP